MRPEIGNGALQPVAPQQSQRQLTVVRLVLNRKVIQLSLVRAHLV